MEYGKAWEGIVYKNEIFIIMLLIIPTKCLDFCCTGLTPSVIYITYFHQKILYHYKYSRHNRPVSVILDSFPKISFSVEM